MTHPTADIPIAVSDTLYKPSAWGELFHSLTVDEALGAGAAGPGKSMVLLMDPIQQLMVEHERCADKRHPYHQAWGMSRGWALHLRRTRPMLDQTIARAKRIFRQIDPSVQYNDKSTTFTFRCGFRYQFGHCKDPNDWEIYMSNEYTHIGFDELIQFEEKQYEQISGRLRTSDPVLMKMLKVRAMSNPMQTADPHMNVHVRNPQWVRERFVDPAPNGKVVIKKKITLYDGTDDYLTRIYLPATLKDNPDPIFVKTYERQLRGKSEFVKQALLYGNWYAVAGSYYGDDWNPNLHICKPFHIPDGWPRWRSGDWGFKSWGVVLWWAMDPDGNIYCEREYNFRGKTAEEVAREIRDIEESLGLWSGGRSQITGPMDTQLWEERGDVGMSKAAEMARLGVHWVKAEKKRTTNGMRLLKRLRDHDNGTITPGIVFFDTCKKCIQTVPAIQTDQNNAETPQDGGEDHWHDSVCYSVAFASHGSRGIPGRRVDDEWADERRYEKRLRRKRSGKNFGYGT